MRHTGELGSLDLSWTGSITFFGSYPVGEEDSVGAMCSGRCKLTECWVTDKTMVPAPYRIEFFPKRVAPHIHCAAQVPVCVEAAQLNVFCWSMQCMQLTIREAEQLSLPQEDSSASEL